MSYFSFFTLSDKGLEENIVRSTIQELVLKRDTTHLKKKMSVAIIQKLLIHVTSLCTVPVFFWRGLETVLTLALYIYIDY